MMMKNSKSERKPRYRAELIFHGDLEDLVDSSKKVVYFKEVNTVKNIIESTGVPHTEFGKVVLDNMEVEFGLKIEFDCKLQVYPKDEPRLDELEPKFISDVHLGILSKYLRFLGFDTLYSNDYSDQEIVAIANDEKRIILTKDRGILKRKLVEDGYLVRSVDSFEQLEEVLRVYALRGKEKLFSRCSVCNGDVVAVDKNYVFEQLDQKTRTYFDEFYSCKRCSKIYWKGSHYTKLLNKIEMILKK